MQTEEGVPERTWRPVATRSDGYLTSIDAEHRWLCLLSEIEICDVYIYIHINYSIINWINWRLRTDSLMLILRGRMSGNQLLPSLAALRCVARLFHQGWLSGLLWPPHASLISNESQHRQGQQSLCSESQPIKLKDRGVLVVQWTDVANGKRMTVSSTHNSSMIQFW